MLGFGQYHQGQTTHLYCAPYRDLAQPLLFLRQRNKHSNGLSNSAWSNCTKFNVFYTKQKGGRGEGGGKPTCTKLNVFFLYKRGASQSWLTQHVNTEQPSKEILERFSLMDLQTIHEFSLSICTWLAENKRRQRILKNLQMLFCSFAPITTHAAYIPKKKAKTNLNISFQLHFTAFINFPAVPLP